MIQSPGNMAAITLTSPPFPEKERAALFFQCLPKRNVLHDLLFFCLSPHKMRAFDIPDPVNPPGGAGGGGGQVVRKI